MMPADLDSWRTRRDDLESLVPWPGPRPLRRDEGEFLVGREDVIQLFLAKYEEPDTRIIILTAESGAGKSSFLEAGLLPRIEEGGWEPLVCNRWAVSTTESEDESEFDVQKHLFSEFAKHLPASEKARFEVSDTPCTDFIIETYGRSCIIVLDQFEELIRYSPTGYVDALKWAKDIARAHKIRLIVSLRSDSSHKLRYLDGKMKPYSMWRYELEPITSEDAVSELLGKVGKGEGPDRSGTIAPEVVKEVRSLWSGSQAKSLLELQALAYALNWVALDEAAGVKLREDAWEAAVRSATSTQASVTEKAWEGFVRRAWSSEEDVLPYALRVALDRKLVLCEKALRQVSPETGAFTDHFLADGVRGLIREIVSHLSSGGFKLHREAWELASQTLDRELSILGHSVDAVLCKGLFEELARRVGLLGFQNAADGRADLDLLSAKVAEIVPTELLEAIPGSGQPWELDSGEVSSGPVLGMHALTVVVEEFRRYFLALHWLDASALVRLTSPRPNRLMISLIHDGFGTSLKAWASSRDSGPTIELSRLTASQGDIFEWERDPASPWRDFNDRTLVNIRWRNCEIRNVWFRNVRFVNCDFRGTRFRSCTFDGAVFVNCLLDGSIVSESTIVGGSPPYRGYHGESKGTEVLPPSFDIQTDPREVELLRKYRGEGRGVEGSLANLVSHTSGLPAVPFTADHQAVFRKRAELEPGDPWLGEIPIETRGFVMLGGRLSSLQFERTSFAEQGTIALRLVSGTALDIVEHDEGVAQIDIAGSAIRGLTITGVRLTQSAGDVNLVVWDSVLAETLIGDRLHGSATFENSAIWQLMSLSALNPPDLPEGPGITLRVADCKYYGLVNTGSPVDRSELDTRFSAEGVEEREAIAKFSSRMDYQSNPGRDEYVRRLQEEIAVWPSFDRLLNTDDS